MRLESALNSSREGLTVHGKALGVVGDNVANVSTNGYKKSRIEFSSLLPEGADGRSSTADPVSGSGVQVSDVKQIFDTGVLEFTGREFDMAIEGNGFFVVGDAEAPRYTRQGNFGLDSAGLLVNSQGQTLLGYLPDSTTLSSINVQDLDLSGTETTSASIFGNVSSASEFAQFVPQNPATFTVLGDNAQFSSSMEVYDSLGSGHAVTLFYYKTGVNTWEVGAYMDGADVGGTDGVPVQVGSTTLNFEPDGSISDANAAASVITATPAYSNGAGAGNFTIDLSRFTQFGAASSAAGVDQNGLPAGDIDKYELRTNGDLYAQMNTGEFVQVATIPIATFANQEGLSRAGNTAYQATDASGTADVGSANTGSRGTLRGATVERSTVDITVEFVELIGYQRGYQANSQMVNAANTMLRDTIQLAR